MQNKEKVHMCARALQTSLPKGFRPKTGLVLGTGLGRVGQSLGGGVTIPYSRIHGYPLSTVPSHAGAFQGIEAHGGILIQEGRCHLYEGYSPEEVVTGIRIMGLLGVETLILTNSAGSLNPLFPAGRLMLVSDHINYTGVSPLEGVMDGDYGAPTRFPDMSEPYDTALAGLAMEEALKLGVRLERGVYLGLRGPQLETRAETRMYRAWGADAVGMSTVLEAIAARHMGMRVLGICSLSNLNLPDCMQPGDLDEMIRVSNGSSAQLESLLATLLPRLNDSLIPSCARVSSTGA